MPEDPLRFAEWLRERARGHSPGYDIAVYARPSTWEALADAVERGLALTATHGDGK